MQGILQLPEYLSGLHESDDDLPMRLLPLLNDLRAARNAPFFTASALFKPNLSPAHFEAPDKVNQRLQATGVLDNVRKLYQMFQFARSGLERGVDVDSHLDYLDKVLVRLVKLCQKTPQAELWHAAGAFVDTLRSGHNSLGAATTAIITELDAQLERLIQESKTILGEPVPKEVLKTFSITWPRAVTVTPTGSEPWLSATSLTGPCPLKPANMARGAHQHGPP